MYIHTPKWREKRLYINDINVLEKKEYKKVVWKVVQNNFNLEFPKTDTKTPIK